MSGSAQYVADRVGNAIRAGDVVQLNPERDERFGGCFLVVTSIYSWGVQGYVLMPEVGQAARAYYRANRSQIRRIGRAEWVVEGALEDECGK